MPGICFSSQLNRVFVGVLEAYKKSKATTLKQCKQHCIFELRGCEGVAPGPQTIFIVIAKVALLGRAAVEAK